MYAALKKIRRNHLKAAISLVAVSIAGTMTAAPAQAQLLGACPSIIQPPPCIIFDYKKLVNWAQTHAQVLQQIDQVKSSIQQTQNTISTIGHIGQEVTNLTKINFQMPDIDNGVSSILTDPASTGITALGADYAGKVFPPTGQAVTEDTTATAKNARRFADMDADVDAYANRIYAQDQTGKSQTDVVNLNQEVNESTTLQGDWVANSHIKIAVMAALTQRASLLAVLLKMQAAHGTVGTDASVSFGASSGAIAGSTLAPVASDTITPMVKQLDALLAQASSLMASVQIVESSNASIAQLQSVIDDYNATVARNTALQQQFQRDAQGWSEHHWQEIVSDTDTAMLNKDNEYAGYRADPTGSATAAQLARRFTAQDLKNFSDDEVDPDQFLGTFADPIKGTLAREISDYLTSGPLDDWLDGDENDEFRDDVLGKMSSDYSTCAAQQASTFSSIPNVSVKVSTPCYVDGLYSLREEVAWKQSIVNGDGTDENPSIQSQIDQAKQTIADESQRQGFDVTTDSITQKLTDIVNQANDLGKQIAASGDANAEAEASQTLAQLQQIVGNGTGLPAVDNDTMIQTTRNADGTVTDNSGNGVDQNGVWQAGNSVDGLGGWQDSGGTTVAGGNTGQPVTSAFGGVTAGQQP